MLYGERGVGIALKTVFRYLYSYRVRMLVGFVIKVAGTLAELVLPYILSHILKNVIVFESVKKIVFWGVMMMFFAAVAWLLNITANRMAAKVASSFSEEVRRDLFAKTLRLSAAQTDRFTIASLESRITTDTYNIHNFINRVQRLGVRAPILLIGGIAITMVMDSYLSMVMVSTLPLIFGIVYFIARKGNTLYGCVQRSVDRMIGVVREDVEGIRVIKALSKDVYEHRRYDAVNRELVRDEERAGVVMGATNPVMTLLMNAGITGVIALSASRVTNHQTDPEIIIAFMQYFTQISTAMMTMTKMFAIYSKCAASAKRVEEVLLCEDELAEQDPEAYPLGDESQLIEFEHVTFSYEGKKPDLEDVSFRLRRGQHLGIIGATGSGKSTLVKLLLRFYDVDSGHVRLEGRDVRTIQREALYRRFGVALQNDFLYADTIAENIRFGREINQEDIEEASKTAQAYDFITAFPDDYRHRLAQKATNLSGGQKQRLLIARALAAKPEILILDDSSSALDYQTEARLRQALEERCKGMTVVTVAQRVSAVKSCDLILVLDEGRVIGSGTHEVLLETCPEYREISDSQMGGAIID